jgi:hypothetical protein
MSDNSNKDDWLARRILEQADLVNKVLARAPKRWRIEKYEHIPMGWLAEVKYGKDIHLRIWSHRSEFEAHRMEYGKQVYSGDLYTGWNLKDPDADVVLKILENALANNG